ncbi:MAG: glycosyltransferase [Erysipelotrichaceae bacterium]
MKQILYFGGIVTENQQKVFSSENINTDIAANNFQIKLLKGFVNNKISIINTPFVNAKKIKKISSFGYEINGINLNSLQYIYFPYLNSLVKYFTIKNHIKKINILNVDVVIFYSLNSYYTKLSKYIKKINKNIKIITIVPDLPCFMNVGVDRGLIFNFLKKLDRNIIEKTLIYTDLIVPFSKKMYTDYLNSFVKKYYVLNGIISSDNYDEHYFNYLKSKYKNRKIITYTGTLSTVYGVENLIKAMKYLPKEYLLMLCGAGDCVSYIKDHAKNICYLGMLKHDLVCSVLKCSDILVNPRTNEVEFDSYCFPSKNMEYLSVNKPIIVYKSKAFEKEFDEVFYYFDDAKPEGIAAKILEVMSELPHCNKFQNMEKMRDKLNSCNVVFNILEALKDSE